MEETAETKTRKKPGPKPGRKLPRSTLVAYVKTVNTKYFAEMAANNHTTISAVIDRVLDMARRNSDALGLEWDGEQ